MRTSICLFLAVITFTSVAVAQSHKDKVELHVQSTSLTLFDPDFGFDHTRPGVGGRVTYNFNRSIAAEAEINYFPQRQPEFSLDGDMIQAQFGVKVGKRFEKFGVFAKLRPGFLTVDENFSVKDNFVVIDGVPRFSEEFKRNYTFTIDAGGVLEWYPSRRAVVRFEAGDTMLRHPEQFFVDFDGTTLVLRSVRPAKFNHNFQFTAGVGFRLGDFPNDDDADVNTSSADTPRFELGAQFTSMTVAPVTRNNPCPDCLSSDIYHTEPGFGGRFTFNLTDYFALDAEGNFFTREDLFSLPNPSGHMFQGQFGPKVGKRFEKWGVFGKFRPGFVGFTKVNELVRTFTQLRLGSITALVGEWRVGKVAYPSLDMGGVVEFYISRRWMARFDIGDTVIRYGEVSTDSFSAREAILRRGVEYHHNLQISSGFAFRF